MMQEATLFAGTLPMQAEQLRDGFLIVRVNAEIVGNFIAVRI